MRAGVAGGGSGVRPEGYDELHPYARIIVDEAVRRGIEVEIVDPSWGELRLSHGDRVVGTRESLSDLTSARDLRLAVCLLCRNAEGLPPDGQPNVGWRAVIARPGWRRPNGRSDPVRGRLGLRIER